MRILVIGCGRVGAELAFRISRAGHEVTVVDRTIQAFDNLHPDYRGRTLQGDVLGERTLGNAGIEGVDGLAAVTNSDAVNAVVAHLARTIYGVSNVVVRSYAPSWLALHQAFGHQVVSSTHWGAQRIDQLLMYPFTRSVFSAGNGEVEVYEIFVPEGWRGRTLTDVLPTGDWRPISVTRTGRALLAGPDVVLQAGDVVHVAGTPASLAIVRQAFESASEGKS